MPLSDSETRCAYEQMTENGSWEVCIRGQGSFLTNRGCPLPSTPSSHSCRGQQGLLLLKRTHLLCKSPEWGAHNSESIPPAPPPVAWPPSVPVPTLASQCFVGQQLPAMSTFMHDYGIRLNTTLCLGQRRASRLLPGSPGRLGEALSDSL